MGPVTSLDAQQPPLGRANLIYGTTSSNNEASSGSIHSSYSSYVLGSAATGIPSAIQSNAISKEAVFPERPGQLDCHYYMKTGDCKYGMTCRFNHPKERASALPNCTLSPLGLPLRQVSSLTFCLNLTNFKMPIHVMHAVHLLPVWFLCYEYLFCEHS